MGSAQSVPGAVRGLMGFSAFPFLTLHEASVHLTCTRSSTCLEVHFPNGCTEHLSPSPQILGIQETPLYDVVPERKEP